MNTTPRSQAVPRLVMLDVDYTLLRPNERFEACGYRAVGERFGLDLHVDRWADAERAAYQAVKVRRLELGDAHDDDIYDVIATAVIAAMSGREPGDPGVQACARAVVAEWTRCENFDLYDDVLPCLARLRAAGAAIGLVSNTNRDLGEIVAFFELERFVDAAVASFEVGLFKPAPEIFQAMLDRTGVAAGDAVMVGDNYEDDVRGALAFGLRAAYLLDRSGRYAGRELGVPVMSSLAELPQLLGA